MNKILRASFIPALLAILPAAVRATDVDVKAFGATGDGRTIDSPAIDRAIAAAAASGGGIVRFPTGIYASYSIHLKSNVFLEIGPGAVILAAEPRADLARSYDDAEPNTANEPYEDFGHSHWHNSLIWGENLVNIGIFGPGEINGYGLSRGSHAGLRDQTPEERAAQIEVKATPATAKLYTGQTGPFGYPSAKDSLPDGMGNKAIALKNCHNITFRDFTIRHGGHFGILATAADNFTLANLKIDTNRDGMDIDSCRNVHVSDCSVNSPFDDGICLKSDYGLGYDRACENITITNCHVSGYDEGTFLSGTYGRRFAKYGAKSGPTGRIKFGTESNGGFKNIAVSNCTFDFCRGLALETVDGGWIEDVAISNLTMRDISNSAIYLRLGARDRGPQGTVPGVLRRVSISNVVASNVDPRFSSIIAGVAGHAIEDVTFSNIRILYKGGGTAEDAAIHPPDKDTEYPEPANHGHMPAYAFFVRHARGIAFHDVSVGTMEADARPPFVLDDVSDVDFDHVRAAHVAGSPVAVLRHVSGVTARAVVGVTDQQSTQKIEDGKL